MSRRKFYYRIEIDDDDDDKKDDDNNSLASAEDNNEEEESVIKKDIARSKKCVRFEKGLISEKKKTKKGKGKVSRIQCSGSKYTGVKSRNKGANTSRRSSKVQSSCVESDSSVEEDSNDEQAIIRKYIMGTYVKVSKPEFRKVKGKKKVPKKLGPIIGYLAIYPKHGKDLSTGSSDDYFTCGPSDEEAINSTLPVSKTKVKKKKIIGGPLCGRLLIATVKRLLEMIGFTLENTYEENKLIKYLVDAFDCFLKKFTEKLADNRFAAIKDRDGHEKVKNLDVLETTLRDFGIPGINGVHDYFFHEIFSKNIYEVHAKT